MLVVIRESALLKRWQVSLVSIIPMFGLETEAEREIGLFFIAVILSNTLN